MISKVGQQNVGDNSEMEVAAQEQNDVASSEAAAANVESKTEVFKLDTDCWDEVFDCLSLEDVHSFGQTCKAFQRVTGQYFQWQYGNLSSDCMEDGIYINGKKMNGFSKFVRKIWFNGSLNVAFPCIGTNCRSDIEEFGFYNMDLDKVNIKPIEKCLGKIENLLLVRCTFNEKTWQQLCKSLTKLKRLTFRTDFRGSTISAVGKHPTLEHLELDLSMDEKKLKSFFGHCPNLRSLQITEIMLRYNRYLICDTNIEDLAVAVSRKMYSTIGVLNELHEHGFYKKLHLRCVGEVPSTDRLLSIPGLVTLYIEPDKDPEYPVLPNIKELGIMRCGPMFKTDALASSFVNLEHLFISGSFNLLPFMRHSAKLRDVQLYKGKAINITALNMERKKLKDARKVTIYVSEDVYLATKWATSNTSLDLIELKRQTSRNIVRPHSFWNIFQ